MNCTMMHGSTNIKLAVNFEVGKMFHTQKQNYTGPGVLYLFHSASSNAINCM